MTAHRWTPITVAGETWEVSADAVMVEGQRVTVTYHEALDWADRLGGQLPTAAIVDARWEQADLKNLPHTQDLGAGENDAQKHSSAIDSDVEKHIVAQHGQPAIVGNVGKHWVEAEHGGFPLYGWHVQTPEPSWRGIKLHPAASSETAAKVIQPYSPNAHAGGNHKDYSSALILCRRPPISDAPDTIPSAAPCWHDGVALDDLTVGERCCMWLGYNYGLSPREIRGPEHDPLILSYSEHCRRGGTFLGVTGDDTPIWDGGHPLALRTDDSDSPWCAALASETLRCALLPGELPPHGLRVSVRELVEDARLAGTLRPVEWAPTPGSLAICARAGHDPLRGGQGHVRCVIQVQGGQYLGLGGNEQDRIVCDWHPLDGTGIRAWIER